MADVLAIIYLHYHYLPLNIYMVAPEHMSWAERGKYSWSAERVLIQRLELSFCFTPIPLWHRSNPHRIHLCLQQFAKLLRNKPTPHPSCRQRVPGVRIWMKTELGMQRNFSFEQAWSDFTGAGWNCRWRWSRIERSGLVWLSGEAAGVNTHVSGEQKFSLLSSAHMFWVAPPNENQSTEGVYFSYM